MQLFKDVSKLKPIMWGTIVGFGNLHYVYKSKREGNMPIIGFANRIQALTLYLSETISDYSLLEQLGKYKTSKACLYCNGIVNL